MRVLHQFRQRGVNGYRVVLVSLLMALGVAEFAPARSRPAAEHPRFNSTNVAGLPAKALPRTSSPSPAPFTFGNTGSLNTARLAHTATLLSSGKVLVAGGIASSGYLSSAELYDPATGTWTATGSLGTARSGHTATLLPSGKVLVGGGVGNSGYLSNAELYDPASGTWTATGSLGAARNSHTATLLPSGKVLVAGGGGSNSAELYDPAGNGGAGAWTATGSLGTARDLHTATLLPSGKVLVAGGLGGGNTPLSSAELYDPASGTWTVTGSLNTARLLHTATLLPSGKVLVAGGTNPASSSAELYDPASGTWTATGSLNTARSAHAATLLPSGKVLVAAGGNSSGVLTSAELYDPANRTWTVTGSLGTGRNTYTATLLPSGKVLVAGGGDGMGGVRSSAELYDPGLGFDPNWQPLLTTVSPSPLPSGSALTASGSRFKGISEASGGNSAQNSSSNYPLVQLRRLDNEQVLFLPVDSAQGWSDTSFTSATLNNFPLGPALVTLFTNGIPSNSKYLLVVPPTLVLAHASSFAYHFQPPNTLLPFEINLPLSGSPGIECRSGDPSPNLHNIFFYFPNFVTFTTNATVSCGTVTFRGSNGNPISVEFDGTGCNQQYVTVTLTGIQDSYGQTLPSASVVVGLLLGDTNGSGAVNASDVGQTKSQSGQSLNASNFRNDVNVNTVINAADIGLVKSMSGTHLGSAAGITSTSQIRAGEAGSPR